MMRIIALTAALLVTSFSASADFASANQAVNSCDVRSSYQATSVVSAAYQVANSKQAGDVSKALDTQITAFETYSFAREIDNGSAIVADLKSNKNCLVNAFAAK
ncbi:hypothetical protein G3R49_00820 [Shewanella sp. WXL01]|uniref:hypothetical protein n=1 Tax=Shewanella sp. WXL01 TaxID=2709721 RepID=UPI0014383368|nr:hypothetical protein [Shewanella sp. WXL01]NKF49117.1 hypothetical protein [Shewanella sp. WXL01]